MNAYAKRRAGFLEWGAFVVFGLALVLLAVPRLFAEYHHMGAVPIVQAITKNKGKIPEVAMTVAAEKLTIASSYAPRNRTLFNSHATIELSLYELSKSQSESDKAFASLSRAQISFQNALKAAPGDANIWYLLAETGARLSGADAKVLVALRLSYLTGPREGWIARRRLGLSLRLWPLLRQDTRKMVRRDIRTLWSLGQYNRELVWHYQRATREGQEAVIAEISREGEDHKTRFLNLAKRLSKRR